MSSSNSENANPEAGSGIPPKRRSGLLVKIGAALAILVAVLLVVIAMQPAEFRVTRSATMAASPATVFAQVNDFHNWEGWSPWIKLDPSAKGTYAGPTSGTGASFQWAGNSDVGEGKMTIVESQPNELISIKLDFLKPMEGTSTAEFTFEPVGDNQTTVTWTMFGENNFIAKAMHLVIDCDKMMGTWFEEGLAKMKSVVESSSKT